MSRVLVLAKEPVAGWVQTRLCPPCTPADAGRIAAAALADTLDAAALTGQVVLAVDGTLSAAPAITVLPQRGDGLGARIAAAFSDAGAVPTLLIGMDTPQVRDGLLGCCLSELDTGVGAVLGPAEDGGWWALGPHEPWHAALLADIPMSTPDTGQLTLAALIGGGPPLGRLPALRDVDHWADALAVARLAPAGRFAAAVGRVNAAVRA